MILTPFESPNKGIDFIDKFLYFQTEYRRSTC